VSTQSAAEAIDAAMSDADVYLYDVDGNPHDFAAVVLSALREAPEAVRLELAASLVREAGYSVVPTPVDWPNRVKTLFTHALNASVLAENLNGQYSTEEQALQANYAEGLNEAISRSGLREIAAGAINQENEG
jgi:hypothetical protein